MKTLKTVHNSNKILKKKNNPKYVVSGTKLRWGDFPEALGGSVNLSLYVMTCLAGFREGYPYPYPHTLYLLESANCRAHRFQPDQLRAKMILFAFGNALAQARLLYGVCMWGLPPRPLMLCQFPALPCSKERKYGGTSFA